MLGKFARVALRTRSTSTTTAASACRRRRPPRSGRSASIAGLPFPLERHRRGRRILLVGTNPAETMPPIMQYFDEQRAAGGRLIVADPRRTPTAQAADLHLPARAGDRRGAGQRPAPRRHPRQADRRRLHRAANDRASRRSAHAVAAYWPDRVERLTGVPADRSSRRRRCSGEARTAIVLTGRGPEQQTQGRGQRPGVHQPDAGAGHGRASPSAAGLPDGAGERPGGARARPEGGPAPRLPQPRRSRSTARHVAGGLGRRGRTTSRGPGRRRARCSAAWARTAACEALLVMGSNLVVSAPDAGALERRLAPLDLLVVADIFLSETARCADVVLPVVAVGGGGRDDDEPGGARLAPRAGAAAARRRAHRSADPEGPGRSRSAAATWSATSREVVFDELRRVSAPAARPTTPASATRGSHAERGAVLALSRAEAPGDAAAVRRPLPHARRAGPLPRRPAAAAGRGAGRRISALPHDRAGAGAVPVGHADPPGAVAARGGAGAVRRRSTPQLAQQPRDRRRRRGSRSPPGAAPVCSRRACRRRCGSDTLFMPFHYAGPGAPTRSPRPRWTRSRRCRSSRFRPRGSSAAGCVRQRRTRVRGRLDGSNHVSKAIVHPRSLRLRGGGPRDAEPSWARALTYKVPADKRAQIDLLARPATRRRSSSA